MTRPSSVVVALAALCVATSSLAQTQVPAFELERLTLNPSARGGLLVGGGDLLPEQQLRLSLTAHYEHDPLVFVSDTNQRLGTIIGSRVTTHLTGAYGVTRWLEVGLQLPVVLWQGGASGLDTLDLSPAPTTALGTPWLQARAALLSQERGAPVDLAVTAMLGLPVGSGAGLTRDDGVSFIPRVGAGRRLENLARVSAELGAWLRPSQPLSTSGGAEQLGSQLDLGLGATTLGEKLRGELSLRMTFPLTQQPVSAELMLGARYPVGPVELYALAGPGFGQAPGTPLFRVLVGAAWGWDGAAAKPPPPPPPPPLPPPPPPAPRCVEGQPYELAACPDLDRDGDGVRNADDRCPDKLGSAATDGCPDTDNDGLNDAADACPTEAGPAERRGCPPKDSDGDGVLDEGDACPTEAGPAERQGCPPKDGDGDGIVDELDACPTEAGDVRYAGCPPKDTDGDGVEDADDNCKTEPGPKDNQGCPAAKKQLVIITREKLVIKDRVYFDTAKSKIQKRSFGLLNQIATILKEHEEVRRVVVEGHTDSRGKAEANRKLSQARAEAVKTFLVQQGVAPERLDAKGYGPDRPVADNKTAAGREENRRVEFVIGTAEKTETQTIEVP